jgi:hypothetical protein
LCSQGLILIENATPASDSTDNVQESFTEESKPPLDTGLSINNFLDMLVPQESDDELKMPNYAHENDNDSVHEALLQSPPPEIAYSRPISRNELRDYDDYELGLLVPLSKHSSRIIFLEDEKISRLNLATPKVLSEDEIDHDDQHSAEEIKSGLLSKASSKSSHLKSLDELKETSKREELVQQLQDALERQEKARQVNAHLQHRLADYYRRKQQSEENKESITDKTPTSEQEQRYSTLLHAMVNHETKLTIQRWNCEQNSYRFNKKIRALTMITKQK